MKTKYNGAEIIIKILEDHGIKKIAGIPGGANLPLYTALNQSSIQHILARHEQGAGFIVQGMARASGKTAVCFATSGPGAANLLTAIADAKLDSVPIIAITGQVPTSMIGTDAFQEVDTYSMTIPITKHNFLIRSAQELLEVLPLAFEIAAEGRPGPVLIDVPKDIQMQEIEVESWPEIRNDFTKPKIEAPDIEKAAAMINQAKKPLLYIGGGIINSGSQELLLELAEKNSIPLVSTLMGLGAFPAKHRLNHGMLGMHGARYTNIMMNEADLLITLGARFDDRATGNLEKFCPKASILHIDIDKAEIDKLKKTNFSINGDLKAFMEQILPAINEEGREKWNNEIRIMREANPISIPDSSEFYNPVNLIKNLGEILDPETIITTDVGQHQMWAAQYYPFSKPRTLLTSGGFGTMGFGLPAAIGAALECPEKMIICISGDGSILMNIQELATLADLNLNVKILLFNNEHLGLVRQQQELFYNQNFIATRFESNPNFAGIANNFGIPGYDLNNYSFPMEFLINIFNQAGPCLINIPIEAEENVFPIVKPGASNTEMIGA
ncbi:MAG: biosynthetic-type acetolactate synthase large subunit [Spirochaetes bacterium]|nr:biosynthetic-type acetolactate synthase large subunit [Spirochaetota bacterium]